MRRIHTELAASARVDAHLAVLTQRQAAIELSQSKGLNGG